MSIGVKGVKIYFLIASIFLLLTLSLPAIAQEPAQEKAFSNETDSDDELRHAIESSGGSESGIIENLEGYLKKYPKSSHLDEIDREIYKLSLKVRDRDRAINYA
ncbi:MAG: hypothetical protein J2P31_07325, partial [Blastocatellia bacterium]|nr:hypothetical protein [Blastocatellia bacterium]